MFKKLANVFWVVVWPIYRKGIYFYGMMNKNWRLATHEERLEIESEEHEIVFVCNGGYYSLG